MPLPRQMLNHLDAMRAATESMVDAQSFTSFFLSAQRIRTSVEHLGLLTMKTPQVGRAASAIKAAIPERTDEAWSPERLLLAIAEFEFALEASGPNRVAREIGAWNDALQSV